MRFENFNNLTAAETERLALLSEEMGEAIQIIGKILRHGYTSTNPLAFVPENENPIQNRWLLEKELGDVQHAITRMCEARDLHEDAIDHHAQVKSGKVQQWLHHQ